MNGPRPTHLSLTLLLGLQTFVASAREMGIDVSQFQGTINWTQVKSSGKTFAFIRSTRGGSNAADLTTSGRYDDPTFITNITQAKATGLLVSAYHFARADTPLLNGSITQDAADEANHFLSIAGPYMAAGYLRPVLDMEAGGTQLSATQLSQWVNTFCSTITAAKGAAADPIVYVSTDYAYNQLDTSVNTHFLWLARYNNNNNPALTNAQTDAPQTPSGYNNPYGAWNKPSPTGAAQNPGPWSFWQYTSLGACPGIDPAVNTVDGSAPPL